MKLNQIEEYEDQILDERLELEDLITESIGAERSAAAGLKAIHDVEDAYADLYKLYLAFENNDFGLLINKTGARLTEADLHAIKREITKIYQQNPMFKRSTRIKAGDKSISNLGNVMFNNRVFLALQRKKVQKQKFEIFAFNSMVALASGFFLGPLGATLTILTSTALFTKSYLNRERELEAIKGAANLLSVLEALSQMKSVKPPSPTKWEMRFKKWVEQKTPKEVQREVEKEFRLRLARAQDKFQNATKNISDTIEYVDKEGKKQTQSTAFLFDIHI